MPYANEHSARLRDPDDFDADSFRRTKGGTIYGSKKVPETIGIIWGKLKGKAAPDDPPIPQALRFPTEDWTEAEAKKWLDDNEIKVVLFEPASEEKAAPEKDGIERRFLAAAAGAEMRVERAADGKPRLTGYAAVFEPAEADIFGWFTERVRRGAFARALREKADVRALVDHNATLILGRTKAGTLRLAEDDRGLKAEIDLPETSAAKDIAASVERGDVDGMSFAFRATKEEWEEPKDGQPVRTLVDVDLFDVSAVTYPAYPDTAVTAQRSLEAWRTAHAPGVEAATPAEILRLKMDLAEAE